MWDCVDRRAAETNASYHWTQGCPLCPQKSELLWLKSSRSWAPPIGLDWICRANQVAMRKNLKVQTAQEEKSKENPRFAFTVIPYNCLFDSASSTPLVKSASDWPGFDTPQLTVCRTGAKLERRETRTKKNLPQPVQPSARPGFRSRQEHDLTPSSLFYLVQFRAGSFPSQVSLCLPTSSSSQPEKERDGHLFLAGARAPRSPKRRKKEGKGTKRNHAFGRICLGHLRGPSEL